MSTSIRLREMDTAPSWLRSDMYASLQTTTTTTMTTESHLRSAFRRGVAGYDFDLLPLSFELPMYKAMREENARLQEGRSANNGWCHCTAGGMGAAPWCLNYTPAEVISRAQERPYPSQPYGQSGSKEASPSGRTIPSRPIDCQTKQLKHERVRAYQDSVQEGSWMAMEMEGEWYVNEMNHGETLQWRIQAEMEEDEKPPAFEWVAIILADQARDRIGAKRTVYADEDASQAPDIDTDKDTDEEATADPTIQLPISALLCDGQGGPR